MLFVLEDGRAALNIRSLLIRFNYDFFICQPAELSKFKIQLSCRGYYAFIADQPSV